MEEESGSLGVVPMSSAEQESSSLVGEDVAETRDEQNDEIDASAAALAERAKASSNVTSFIVSNESAVGPAALPQRSSHEQQDGNVVEPVVGEDDEDEDQYSSGKPVEVKASVKEPPVTPADDQTCTMRGEIGDQGRVVGRWGMTRDALNDVDQTCVVVFVAFHSVFRSKFEYKRKVVRGAAPIAELSSYEPHALAVRLSGPYVGYFLLRVVNKAQPLKVEERTMTLVFSINTDDRFNIRGGGKNRTFVLSRRVVFSSRRPSFSQATAISGSRARARSTALTSSCKSFLRFTRSVISLS